MTLQPYDSDDAARQIRHADMEAQAAAPMMDRSPEVVGAVALHYLRAIAVGVAAIAARLEQG